MPAIEHNPATRLRDHQPLRLGSLGVFLRARPELLREWMLCRPLNLVVFCAAAIVIGAGVYGGVMGSWRSPWQALYTGIKLPLAILLTTLGNGLLNGMLAPLLGLNLTIRQSLSVVLMSFAIMAVVLGAMILAVGQRFRRSQSQPKPQTR